MNSNDAEFVIHSNDAADAETYTAIVSQDISGPGISGTHTETTTFTISVPDPCASTSFNSVTLTKTHRF
jgi:hypothetical protein